MNWFGSLLVVSGAGVFGYFAEPALRLELTGISPVRPVSTPVPAIAKSDPRAEEISKVDLFSYHFEQLPKEIVLKKDALVTDAASGTKMTIAANSRVKIIRLENGMIIFGTGAAGIEGAAEVYETDIREQLLDKPPAPMEIAVAPASDTPSAPNPDSPPPGATMAKAEPAEPAAENPEPAGNETANMKPETGNPALAPEVTKPAEPVAEFSAIPADEIVKIMQESIQAAQIKEFKFDQVSEWTAGEPEDVDGKKFNTGLVSYKGQTFLGVKTIQAKAYINGGKVIRWIMPKSGMEIK